METHWVRWKCLRSDGNALGQMEMHEDNRGLIDASINLIEVWQRLNGRPTSIGLKAFNGPSIGLQ
eukprot:3978597-Amphidinium_carterae.1